MKNPWKNVSTDALWEIPWKKSAFVALNFILACLFLVLPIQGVLPLDPVHFAFFLFAGFLVALYRPGWAFLLLIGMLPFETTNLAPAAWGFDLRPYQLASGLLALALFLRLLTGKLRLSFFRFDGWDALAFGVGVGAFLAVPGSEDPGTAFRMALILLSFGLLYFLIRQFLRSPRDMDHIEPFLYSSAIPIFLFALWQNVRFKFGSEAYMVMAGRPNGSFPEADWLGMYAAFIALFILVRLYQRLREKQGSPYSWAHAVPHFLLLLLAWSVIIVSVSRSAWVAAVLGLCVLTLWSWVGALRKQFAWREFSVFLGSIKISLLLSVVVILLADLTTFDLSNRVESTAGLQTITVSCEQAGTLPEKIESTEALSDYGCRHIDLEEIEGERNAGRVVSEVERPDPNVSIRAAIYRKTWETLKEHVFLGIGWGNISSILGTDARGEGLNSSNMFLEVWLGSGLIGFLSFLILWCGMAAFLLQLSRRGRVLEQGLLALWIAFTVFNLFNAGLLLGFFFFFLALGTEVISWHWASRTKKNA